MVFANTVHEEFNTTASRARVNVEPVAADEQLSESSQDAPIRSFVEILRSEVLELLIAAKACQRGGVLLRIS